MYRTPTTNYKHMYSNKELYNAANIPRIDNFMIDLTRNYYQNIANIDNKIVKSFQQNNIDYQDRANTGYFPPHFFTAFDNAGLIQNSDNIPIIYHYTRHKANKYIKYTTEDCITYSSDIKYSTAISPKDFNNFNRINKNYWWLSKNSKTLEELRKRARHKQQTSVRMTLS